ncbi:hypothetical protein [Chitiniphilus eburneus]|uniref:Lytic transglycosylase domain-containing protein n=1 Tax=Chitiniphilus eburneus TaxID=2571148 RepID=A0A4V5MQU6_9NEIS|nr:hypothetical protein [Chitiniphilus eburneus]TJZ73878.1 hypothetical protein FAZ21_09690 [Chitiniphilus eburneus]
MKEFWSRELKPDLVRLALLAAVLTALLLLAGLPVAARFGLDGVGYFAAMLALVFGLSHVLTRAIVPRVGVQRMANRASIHPIGAAVVYASTLAFRLGVAALLVWLLSPRALAADIAALPANAQRNLPLLSEEQARWWPELRTLSTLAAQVEQETCAGLKSARCWSERAELKTPREYGFGLGQCTTAYRVDGAERFSCHAALRARHAAALSAWTWANRFDARLQLRALLLQDKALYAATVRHAATERDALAFMLNQYNAGPGMLAKSRSDCARRAGCDPGRWFGHVEVADGPSKVAGYSRSFHAISREYVRNVLVIRQPRYTFLDA